MTAAPATGYDRERFGHILNWDRHSFILHGKRVYLAGGEFHYWRLPDRTRWRETLIRYRMGGLNCVRIYFHWGYHNPAPGVFRFDGARDIRALMELCRELGLYVLASPGPYICAETSAGGFPGWLVGDRSVRLRHLRGNARVQYDEHYARACREWYAAFFAQINDYQITANPEGHMLAVQIENELIQKKFFNLRLEDYMRELMLSARRAGCSLPFFHNDPWVEGSWAAEDPAAAPVDLYSFDRYIIWCPRKYDAAKPPRWSEKEFAAKLRGEEQRVRQAGGRAATSPIFVAELQGGWFNQWGHDHGFDEIYDYYGEDYQRTLVESLIAEGMSAFSIYMYYGGTNWGALGDPDVYTSYDYSAAIREHGFLSGRMHQLRKTILFARSFTEELVVSEALASKAETERMLAGARRSPSGAEFYFLRNFSGGKQDHFELKLSENLVGRGRLAPRRSFIAVAGLPIGGGKLALCTLPILARLHWKGGEAWFLEWNGGDLYIQGDCHIKNGAASLESVDVYLRLRFPTVGRNELQIGGRRVQIVVLSPREARSFGAEPERGIAWWGPQGAGYLPSGRLEIESLSDSPLYTFRRGVVRQSTLKGPQARSEPPRIVHQELARVVFEKDIHWQEIDFQRQRNPMDHGFHFGHVLYALRYHSDNNRASIRVNARHRLQIWLNGKAIGGHITYGYRPGTAGAKNGPDPSFLGARRYELDKAQRPGENILYLLTESLGYNRGPFAILDFRNPRGLLSADLRGGKTLGWQISGQVAEELECSWAASGLPGEKKALQSGGLRWRKCDHWPTLDPDLGVFWYRARFRCQRRRGRIEPLQVVLRGSQALHIYVNGVYIGRYWGDFGPQQRFYIPDGLLRQGDNSLLLGGYALARGPLQVSIEDYVIDPASGNVDPRGVPYVALRSSVVLQP